MNIFKYNIIINYKNDYQIIFYQLNINQDNIIKKIILIFKIKFQLLY